MYRQTHWSLTGWLPLKVVVRYIFYDERYRRRLPVGVKWWAACGDSLTLNEDAEDIFSIFYVCQVL